MDAVMQICQKFLHKVKRSGPENIMALCPFHDNKNTPSFTMSLTKGLFYCFSCHERGTLMTFLRNVGVSRAAIGVHYKFVLEEVERYRPKAVDPLRPTEFKNEEIPEALLGLFDKCPVSLIEEDGFDEEMLQRLDIGFDDQHMRITFPLRDLDGKLVGISGRSVTDDYPKYKVYDKEFEDFDLPKHKTYRSQLLWNGHMVYPEAFFTNGNFVVGVEGFKACMRFLQAGVPNTLAILGSFMSSIQRQQIERMASEFYIMLDGNDAGMRGTVIAGMRMGIPVRVCPYLTDKEPGPKGLQPSDLEPDELLLALSEAKDFYRWLQENPAAMSVYRERKAQEKQFRNART
jgi:DNA primase